ncbi:hypothetical protein EVG20_g5373, partial [Dentipellis fragilis]
MPHSETPFKIAVPDDALALLHQKLAFTRLPDELDEAGWEYGAPLADVKRLVARWRDGSEVETAVPLLFVHGWPGSFLEVRKILPLLTRASKEHPSFHVVAFSLPGYGFSEGAHKKGFSMPQYAELANKLMLALGYEEYVMQGGDWGHLITRHNAAMNGPKHVKAWHSNIAYPSPPSLLWNPLQIIQYLMSWYSAEEKAGLERTQKWMKTGQGYMVEQSTKPQTLGYSLADSPVGLLAWIYEKLATLIDEYLWEDDEILTWISIYWFSRDGPAASIRIYYEVIQANQAENMPWSSIPLGLSHFPKEVVALPKSWSGRVGNVVLEVSHDSGGHFAAHEKPEQLVGDLRKMFGKGGPAFGAVPGRSGRTLEGTTKFIRDDLQVTCLRHNSRGNMRHDSPESMAVVEQYKNHSSRLLASQPTMSNSSETPFKIAIPDDALALLSQKLALTRLPDELDEAGWQYGVPLADVKRLVARWKDGYDWRAHEAKLNAELPMFTRDISVEGFGSLNIHYI